MKKFFLAVFLLFICISVYSQNEFAKIKKEVNTWYSPIKSASTVNTKAFKTIEFNAQHYSIVGTISKGILCEGTIAKFYETSSLSPSLLLEGRVEYQNNRLVVEGVKYDSVNGNKIYGSFYVYNKDDYSMSYKAKKAGDLHIKCKKAYYLEGFYLQCPVIVSLVGGVPSVYVDGKTGGRGYAFLSALIPGIALNEDDSFDVYQILLQAKNDATMCWDNEVVFKGSVKPTIREDNAIVFLTLEGQQTGMTTGPKRISVSRENGNIVYSQDYNEDNKLLSNETLYVRDNGTLSEMDYWNTVKIYENCYLAKWTYRNGNYFEGSIKTVITPNENTNTSKFSSTATKGIFKYPNGDRFEGDLSTLVVGPFYIDGTTYFADGTVSKGNWLYEYKLTKEHWDKVYKCTNPTEARALAEKLTRSYYYQDYVYSKSLKYFDPTREDNSVLWFEQITYDKTNKHYFCKYGTIIKFEFAVDNNGYRKWEIVYGDNNQPEYINEFKWYSNGEIESIKSYYYSTKLIYLSCNFFSDGKLRSAYQYGPSNSGKNILRKSKEAHPTMNYYTSKLYDLNGNYERSIEWNIGEGWLSSYKNVAPARLEFDKLIPVDD